jgi:hypothetical protein
MKLFFISFFLISSLFVFCNLYAEYYYGEIDSLKTDNDTLNLSPEEQFSAVIIEDFLGEEDDEDLQYFLEEEIFPIVKNSDKISFDKISTSLYLLHYILNGQEYNYIIQRFYDAVNQEVYFEKTLTSISALKIYINK